MIPDHFSPSLSIAKYDILRDLLAFSHSVIGGFLRNPSMPTNE